MIRILGWILLLAAFGITILTYYDGYHMTQGELLVIYPERWLSVVVLSISSYMMIGFGK